MTLKIFDRMLRAARLDVSVYEEVEKDKGLLIESMIVVVLSTLAAGIGNIASGTTGIIIGIITALIGWFAWAFLILLIGTKVLPEPNTKSDIGELLRTLGFAASPGVLRVFGVIPGMAPFVFTVAGIWMVITMVIAVRQALDYTSTARAIGVCLIGWVVQLVVVAVIMMFIISPAAPLGVVAR